MATFTKVKLSGSTDGRGILIAATADPGTTIHTAHATSLDEIWLWACNLNASDRQVTVEFGGSGNADLHQITVPSQSGLIMLVPGLVLTSSVVVKVYAALANVVNVIGYVNRIG